MKNWKFATAAAFALAAAFVAQTAEAQFGYVRPQTNPINRPTVSPYLNLARGGNVGINYYALVRPQQQAFQSLQQLQAGQQFLSQQQQRGAPLTGARFGSSGLRTYFFNYGRYYPGLSGQTGGSIQSGQSIQVGGR